MRIIPYSALHFGAYEHYRARLVAATGARPGSVPPTVDLLAGSAAGATAVLATYPLDLVRTRLAYQMEGEKSGHGHRHRATVRSVLAATVRAEGLAGLYRGVGPTLVGILPYAGLKFYVYQKAKAAHAHSSSAAGAARSSGGGGEGGQATAAGSSTPAPPRASAPTLLAFGAAAGLVAQTATYPLDVVRRQMQVQGLARMGGGVGAPGAAAAAASAAAAGPPAARLGAPLTSTLGGLAALARSGGARALFAGVSINYLKVVPSTAIGFTVYDGLKGYLALPHNL
jgi:hypothetical protein